ncbi:hypothetical protein CEP54_012120 [Fusarium duplospermum]|uniref:Uncharacterized protein n=1 Tax=Fusarium duplospermum TaxID=1325734 RepID=A0A428PAI3_9HYPO|nr:hypothetical protein CEP54_012120 [Fusarium duplospermum]
MPSAIQPQQPECPPGRDESPAAQPIAIIGLSGRFGGEAENPGKLWEMLKNNRSALGKVPETRYNPDGFYHPNGERAGTSNTKEGYFIKDDVRRFDAGFFSITPVEAEGMDPTQRILLEMAYESLENAGMTLNDVNGADMACFVGACQRDYWDMQTRDIDASAVSWFFNLKGPSATIDTACSSSLTALNMACQSIRSGESKTALVGGMTLILLPHFNIYMSTLSFLSPDNRCHSFDERANGYARGEGGGFLVLKSLDAALRDGDTIRAVIRATGANQDGRTPGITLPSGPRQEMLIKSTYEKAGLDPARTGFFEAHGTGTSAGDPIECSAIGSVFGSRRQEPILVGSVKSSVGHLEGSSAIAGLFKAIYSLESGMIAPTFGLENINPSIRTGEWNLDIPTSLRSWPKGLRRISINSFGYGGGNAHCVLDDAHHYLEEHGLSGGHNTVLDPQKNGNGHTNELIESPVEEQFSDETSSQARRLFVWSSPEKAGLARLAIAFKTHLEEKAQAGSVGDKFLGRLALTLSERRTRFPWRLVVDASTIEDLISGLDGASSQVIKTSKESDVVFIFTGQGAQWFAMGRELLNIPVFKSSLDESSRYLYQQGSHWNLMSELSKGPEDTRINEPELSQPACTALQIALVELLRSWGVHPRAVIGHSSGEIAAAFTKGAISQDDALKIAYFRGLLSSQMKKKGSMAAVGLSPLQAKEYIERVTDGKIVVACINSPSSVTLSGDVHAVDEVVDLIKLDGHFARKLAVQTAYHSHHMNSIADRYLDSIRTVTPRKPANDNVTMISSVTSQEVSVADLGPEYWVKNLVNPVNFSGAVQTALGHSAKKVRISPRLKISSLVELGPHSALQGPLRQVLEQTPGRHQNIRYVSILKRKEDAVKTAVQAAGILACVGYAIDFSALNHYHGLSPKEKTPLVDLPSYPWNRDRVFWQESAAVAAYRNRRTPRLDLLGVLDENSTLSEPSWKNYLRISEQPWIEHHKFQGTNIYPMAGMIVMAIEGLRQILNPAEVKGYQFRDVTVHQALVVPSDQSMQTKLDIRPWRHGSRARTVVWRDFTVSSRSQDGAWTTNATGLVSVEMRQSKSGSSIFVDEEKEATKELKNQLSRVEAMPLETQDPDEFYSDVCASGLDLGPSFRCVSQLKAHGTDATFVLTVQNTKKWAPLEFEHPHLLHPATLDGFVHLLISSAAGRNGLFRARVPVFVESLFVSEGFDSTPGSEYFGYCSSSPQGVEGMVTDLTAFSKITGEPRVVINGCRSVPLTGGNSVQKTRKKEPADSGSLEKWMLGPGEQQAEEDNSNIYCSPRWDTDVAVTLPDAMKQILEKFVLNTTEANGSANAHDNGHANGYTNGYTNGHANGSKDRQSPPAVTTNDLKASRLDKALIHYIGLTLHKTPGCKILELADTTPDVSDVVLEGLDRSFGISKGELSYTVAKKPEANGSEQKGTNTSASSSNCLNFDIEKDLADQDVEAKSYDLVLVGEQFLSQGPTALKLERCKQLLTSCGTLVIVGGSGHDFRDVLQQAGFDGVEFELFDSSGSNQRLSMTVCKLLPGESKFPANMVIVTGLQATEPTNQLVGKLRQTITTAGCAVETRKLQEVSAVDFASTFFLVTLELDGSVLSEMDGETFSILKRLATESRGVLWLANDEPLGSIVKGFSRTVRAEHPDSCFSVLSMESGFHKQLDQICASIVRSVEHVWSSRPDNFSDREFRLRDGQVQVERLRPNSSLTGLLSENADANGPPVTRPFQAQGQADVRLRIRHPGALDSLDFVETAPQEEPLKDYEIEMEIKTVGLNFRDVMVAMGQLQDDVLGIECSGRVVRLGPQVKDFAPGDRVFGMHPGCFKSSIRVDSRTFEKIPSQTSYDEAATIPCTFGTAYYALHDVAHLQPGESVLIHSAAGGVGQAAIRVAQHIGATIYATVSTSDKRDFLVNTYGLLPSNILNSRDLSFKHGILRLTENRGVDVVLNSLAGEALRQSWLCVAPFGRFIELGKRDMYDNTGLDMLPFATNITFSGVDLLMINKEYPWRFQKIMRNVVSLMNKGVAQPLPSTQFSLENITAAFRSMQSGKHMGKLVINCENANALPVVPASLDSFRFPKQATYVLVGGLGGIGRSIGKMMVDIGASNLIFISRSMDSERQEYVDKLRQLGVTVEVSKCDVSDELALKSLLEDAKQRLPPIKGVINCAMNLKDGIIENMTVDRWNDALRPKVQATLNLERLLNSPLDFFICLSSVAGIVGSRGQSNYNAGNTFQDAFAHSLSESNVQATSLNLSLVTDVGVSTTRNEVFQLLKGGGLIGMDEQDVLKVVRAAVAGRCPPQVVMGLASGGRLSRQEQSEPYWFTDSRFLPVRAHGMSTAADDAGGESDLKCRLPGMKTLSEVTEAILFDLVGKVSQIANISREDIDSSRAVNSYGIDSLSAVEIRTWISKELGASVSVFDIVSNSTMTELVEKIGRASSLVSQSVKM